MTNQKMCELITDYSFQVKPELDETEHTEISVEKEQVSSSDVNNVVTSTDGDAAGNNDENVSIDLTVWQTITYCHF